MREDGIIILVILLSDLFADIPVRDRSVDVILTDLPFGKKHRAKQLHHLYTHCCQQFYRFVTLMAIDQI